MDALAAREAEAKAANAFTPSTDWQPIPAGTAVPPGGDFRMDMGTGVNYGRWPAASPAQEAERQAALGFAQAGNFNPSDAAFSQAVSQKIAEWDQGPRVVPYVPLDRNVGVPASQYEAQTGVYNPLYPPAGGFTGKAPAPPASAQAVLPGGAFQTFAEARALEADLTTDLNDRYAQLGRLSEIGGGEYQANRMSILRDAGLRPALDAPVTDEEREAAQGWLSKVDKDAARGTKSAGGGEAGERGLLGLLGSKDMEFGIAYGGMQTIGGLNKALSPIVSGDAYLAGQVQEQAGTSVLPLIGAVAGTGIGGRFGQPLAGQFIGQSIGQGAEGLFDQYAAGHTFAQERAGESLAVGRGGADAANEFADTLKSVVTPAAKELAETFQRLGQTGPVSASGAAGLAPFQTDFGTAFGPTVDTENHFLSGSPFLAKIREKFGTGRGAIAVPEADYLGAAGVAASTGDYQAMMANLGFAQAKAGRDVTNPAWQRDRDFVDRYNKNAGFGQDVKDFFTWDGGQGAAYEAAEQRLGDAGPGGAHVPGAGEAQYLSRKDKDKAAQLAKMTTDFEGQYETFQQDQAGITGAGALLGADSARLKLRRLQGGGAAALRGAQGGLEAGASAGIDALETDISTLAGYRKQYPGMSPYYNSMIAEDREKEAAFRAVPVENSVSTFQMGLKEESAGFSLSETRARIEGKSAAEIERMTRRQARFLESTAADPSSPLDQAERSGLLSDALTEKYQARLNTYDERLGGIDVAASRVGVGLARAEATGTPDDVYRAQGQELDTFKSKIAELAEELRQGGLAIQERQQKERDLNQTRAQAASLDHAREEQRAQSNLGLADTGAATQSVGLQRRLDIGGTTAFPTGLLDTDRNDIAQAQGLLRAAKTPKEVADAQFAIAQRQERLAEDTTQSQIWRPDSQTRVGDMRAEGAFRRSELVPFMDGPDSNPLTKGNELLGRYQKDLANEQARNKDVTDPRAIEANAAWEENMKDKIAGLQHARLSSMFDVAPEMVIGAAGAGVEAAVGPLTAMSARAGGLYNPRAGSWGRPPASDTTHLGGGEAAAPGGKAGAFSDAASAAIVAKLSEILSALKTPSQPGPPNPSGAVLDRAVRQANIGR